jgi:hypothetical protein
LKLRFKNGEHVVRLGVSLGQEEELVLQKLDSFFLVKEQEKTGVQYGKD